MTQSNNVKFVEADGKWLWKRYDENGSVIFRSPLFDTEREAREDYDINGGTPEDAKDVQTEPVTPENSINTDTVPTATEESNTAGSATADENTGANNAGDAGMVA